MKTTKEYTTYKCDVCGHEHTENRKSVLSGNVRVLFRIHAHDGYGVYLGTLDVCRDCVDRHPDEVLCSLIPRKYRNRHVSFTKESVDDSTRIEELEEELDVLRDDLARAHASLDELRAKLVNGKDKKTS